MKKKILLLLIFWGPFFLLAEEYEFSGDFLKSVMTKGEEITILEGNVLVGSDTKKISAGKVSIEGEDFDLFRCEGGVKVQDLERDLVITSETLMYDNKQKIVRIDGPSETEDKENSLIIKCGFLENREEENLIILQVGVRILKEDLACRSEFAVYFRDRNFLELTGMPVVYRKEDVFRASKISVDLDTDEILMEGLVQGSLLSEEKSTKEEKAKEKNRAGKNKTASPGKKEVSREKEEENGE